MAEKSSGWNVGPESDSNEGALHIPQNSGSGALVFLIFRKNHSVNMIKEIKLEIFITQDT